ncbi:MAG: right-handed parallel beta-helix repeat-containing protein, partial [Candidatus Bathyarchaeota archaeon]
MNRKLIFGVVLVLFLMGIPESLLALGPAQAAPSTVLYIEPSSIVDLNLIPGHNFTIDLMVADVEYLFAWQANITFDPSVIEFLNVTEGGFLQDQPEGSFFAYVVENATDGWILIGATTLGPYQGASGSGTLAVIEFHVLTYGDSTIHIVTEPKWYDWNENGIIDPGELIYTTILQGQDSPNPPPNFYDIEFTAEDGYFTNEAFETIYIRSDGSIDPPTAPIVRDGDLYTLVADIFSETDGIVIERGDMTLDGGGYGLVGADDLFSKGIISYSDNLTIRNLEVRDFPWGIDLESSSNHIFGNNISGCRQFGISLYGSSNEVYGNNVTDCQEGISLYLSPGSSVYENHVELINHYHISLSGCSHSTVHGNTILNGLFGGFYLGDSENCTVYGNSLVENYMYGIVVIRAINNVIYHNNIINSTTPVYSSDSANAWDNGYPSGGNYWSDYTG